MDYIFTEGKGLFVPPTVYCVFDILRIQIYLLVSTHTHTHTHTPIYTLPTLTILIVSREQSRGKHMISNLLPRYFEQFMSILVYSCHSFGVFLLIFYCFKPSPLSEF